MRVINYRYDGEESDIPKELLLEIELATVTKEKRHQQGQKMLIPYIVSVFEKTRKVALVRPPDKKSDQKPKQSPEAIMIREAELGAKEIMFVAESWIVRARSKEDAKRILLWQKNHKDGLASHPRRVDSLTISHYSSAGDFFAEAEIREGVVVGDWLLQRSSFGEHTTLIGRFSHIFLKKGAKLN